jgi:hypothetical protein
MSDIVGFDEGQEDEVVLLTLVLIDCRDLVRLADQGIVGASEKLSRMLKNNEEMNAVSARFSKPFTKQQ